MALNRPSTTNHKLNTDMERKSFIKKVVKLEENCLFLRIIFLPYCRNDNLLFLIIQQEKGRKKQKCGTTNMCNKNYYPGTAYIKWFHGVVVITPDFESGNLGSNPGGTYPFYIKGEFVLCQSKDPNFWKPN